MARRSLIIVVLTVAAGSWLAAPPPATAGPAIMELLGERFVLRDPLIGSSDLGIGFDPERDWILALGLTDLCGDPIDVAFVADQADVGTAWDPVGLEFWFIDPVRNVYRSVNDQPEVIFTIPATFLVPGVGLETLDTPTALAMDLEHVYVLDRGPTNKRTTVEDNQWFKFTREGTPISSSGANDFVAELEPHFAAYGDCIVAGMTWIPTDAPFGEGLFLVAVANSGIQVVDADGFYVERIIWQDEGFPAFSYPSDCAGIAIDPGRGDLYLTDRSGPMLAWERLQDPGPQALIFGSIEPRLHLPQSECGRGLRFDEVTQLFYGLTYRNADGLLWTVDFITGDLYTMEPLTAQLIPVGNAGVPNVTGLAYDDERDVIYMFYEPAQQIYILDPVTLETTTLPNTELYVAEIAYNRDDGFLYGVGFVGTGPGLIRIDRETGVSSVVGPTANVQGIAYDRSTGRLVGIDATNDRLFSIDPATGDHEVLVEDTGSGGAEGLAAVVVSEAATSAAPFADPRVTLRAYPNPIIGHGQVTFAMPRSGQVTAAVYDLRGQRVADLFTGTLPAGPQSLHWNARDRQGRAAASGVYLVRVTTPWETAGARITIVR